MKILAIDFGTKRMGFAIGNIGTQLIIPLGFKIVKNNRQILQEIRTLISEYEIDVIIIGVPVNMDGTPCPTGKKVEGFTRFLKKHLPLEITPMDERLSSWDAEEQLKTQYSSFRKRKKKIDGIAAGIILRDYLIKNETIR